LDETDFTVRIAEILVENNINFEIETLDNFVRANYPDLRKTINNVQMACVDNKLMRPEQDDTDTAWRIKMVELFKQKQFRTARELIIANATIDEFEEIFVWLYRNLKLYCTTEDQEDQAVIIIRNGMVKHTQVADPEINLSATMAELSQMT
jgi:hypothetical protein